MTGLLTRLEVGDYLKMHPRTVDGLIATGALPAIKFERSVRIDPRDLERFLEAHKRGEARATNASLAEIDAGAVDDRPPAA